MVEQHLWDGKTSIKLSPENPLRPSHSKHLSSVASHSSLALGAASFFGFVIRTHVSSHFSHFLFRNYAIAATFIFGNSPAGSTPFVRMSCARDAKENA